MHTHDEAGRNERKARASRRAGGPAGDAWSAVASGRGGPSPTMLLALQRSVGNAAVVGMVGGAADREAVARPTASGDQRPAPRTARAIQRKVRMYTQPETQPDGVDLLAAVRLAGGALDEAGLFDFLTEQIRIEAASTRLTAEEEGRLGEHSREVSAQLYKWAAGTPGVGSGKHLQFGRKQQDRHYGSYSDLARALLGWVRSKGNRGQEKRLAHEVRDASEVELHMDSLLLRIQAWIEDQKRASDEEGKRRWRRITTELTSGTIREAGQPDETFGHYQKYFDVEIKRKGNITEEVKKELETGIKLNMWKVLTEPALFGFRQKVIVLHDLMEYFGPHQRWNPRTQGNQLVVEDGSHYGTTTAINAEGQRTSFDNDRGQQEIKVREGRELTSKRFPSTRDESALSTRLAREHDIPVWAGSSFTAMRMLNLASHVGGTQDELSAVAWAIFSFWRLDYDHSEDLAYHTLHEVMDIAQNFGIPYNLLRRSEDLQRHEPGRAKESVLAAAANLTARVDLVAGEVATLKGEFERHGGKRGPEHLEVIRHLGAIDARFIELRRGAMAIGRLVRRIEEGTAEERRARLREALLTLPRLDAGLDAVLRLVASCRKDVEELPTTPPGRTDTDTDTDTGTGTGTANAPAADPPQAEHPHGA